MNHFILVNDRICWLEGMPRSGDAIWARERAEELDRLADLAESRAPFARDNHLDDPELSGGSRRLAGSEDDGGQL